IELDPKSAHAYMERGTLVADRDPAAALADVAKAVELDPKKSAAWRWLGLLRLKADDMKGALEAYDRSIELDPKDAMSFEGRAAARDALGDYEGTIADAERFHELLPERLVDPTLARAWVKRAITRSNAGDHAGALLDWTRAVEVGPRDPETWFGRGKEGAVAIQAGSVPDADAAPLVERSMADLSRAIGLAPSMSDAFYTRGLLCEVKGDKAGAIADYERFLELVPKDELAPSVREKLAALKGKP
ncbi:tetratricopeptide repeat protein, partial [bacterium]|nr:tetratricopeptide repeat protein [bacterium]